MIGGPPAISPTVAAIRATSPGFRSPARVTRVPIRNPPGARSTGAPPWGSPDPSRFTGATPWGSPDPSGPTRAARAASSVHPSRAGRCGCPSGHRWSNTNTPPNPRLQASRHASTTGPGRSLNWGRVRPRVGSPDPRAAVTRTRRCRVPRWGRLPRPGNEGSALSTGPLAPLPPPPSPPTQGQGGRADQAGVGAEAGGDDRGEVTVAAAVDVALEAGPGRGQQQVAGGGDPAADHHQVGVEDGDQGGDPDPEPVADALEQGEGGLVALAGGGEHDLAGHRGGGHGRDGGQAAAGVGGGRLPAQAAQGRARGHRLQAAEVAAGAAVPVGGDDQVAELAREPVLAVVEPTLKDQSPADPGADGDQHQVAPGGPGAEAGLGPGGGVGVVVDGGRQAGPLVQEAAQLHPPVAVVGGQRALPPGHSTSPAAPSPIAATPGSRARS